ncbi:hypothetical protein D3C85_14880 [compost metagenome]
MNKTTVSNEDLVLGGMLATAAGSLLLKYGPQVAKAIAGKVAEIAGTKAMQTAKEQLSNTVGSDLVRFTQSARVEPILLMDKNAANVPFIQDVVHTAFNMFTGYWLLAVSLDTKINGVTMGRRLDKFATDRSLGDATLTMLSESMESYKASMEGFGLPFMEEIMTELETASMESSKANNPASQADIDKAQRELGVKFAPGYIAFLKKFGVLVVGSREIYGLGPKAGHLDVVSGTKDIAKYFKTEGLYVIESLGVDSVFIAADSKGNLYKVSPTSETPMKSTFSKYLDEALAELETSMEANQMERANAALDIIDGSLDNLTPEERKLREQEGRWRREDDQERNKADEEDKRRANAKQGMGVAGAAKYVEKITNLAVGNVIDVTISEDGKEATVPVTVRLRVAGMPSDVMVQTLAVGGKDVTFRSRWRAWRAGEIGFWADFVLAMDRVDAHRAAMMKDETGYYKAVYGRATNNTLTSSILKDGPSLATASSILVMTTQTASALERRISGELKNFKTRQGIFGHTYSMLMIVIDPDWESVTIYTRGIEMPTQLTAKDIKAAGKSDSKELMEILKSYQLGRAPGRI